MPTNSPPPIKRSVSRLMPRVEEREVPAIPSPKRTRMIVYGALVLLEIIEAVRAMARKAVITNSNEGTCHTAIAMSVLDRVAFRKELVWLLIRILQVYHLWQRSFEEDQQGVRGREKRAVRVDWIPIGIQKI